MNIYEIVRLYVVGSIRRSHLNNNCSTKHILSFHPCQAVVTNATDFVPPAWSCGVHNEQEELLNNSTTRHLVEHDHHGHSHLHHDHSDHDHSDHDHSPDHDFDPSNDHALSHVQQGLRGSEMRIGKRRRVLQGGSNSSYAYWVDIYIEIDYELCNDNFELALCNAGTIGPNTINYGTLFLFDNTYSPLRLLFCCISSTHTIH